MNQDAPVPSVDSLDPYLVIVANLKGVSLEAAEREMRQVQLSHGISRSAFVEEEMFRCNSAAELEAAANAWQERRGRLAAMVASSAGWTLERAMERMREVEARWPQLTFPIFLTHSLHLFTNDEIAEKAVKWEQSLEKRGKSIAAASGLSPEEVTLDLLERQAEFGLQSKYYRCYKAWELSDWELETYATRRSAKVLYDALNLRPEEVDDKLTFGLRFGGFLQRKSWTNRNTSLEEFLTFAEGLDQAFCKPADSDQGRGVYVLDLDKTTPELAKLYEELIADEGMLLEQMIEQHSAVAAFYPKAVNTIRVLTVKMGDQVDIIASAARFGRLGNTDNFSMNGMVSDVDVLTGKLVTPAIDKRGVVHHRHPETGKWFVGFTIPMWDQVRALVTAAALRAEHNDFIGWDVAICEDHVSLVEGNARPGTGLVQAPYSPQHIGRHYVFEPYIKMLAGDPVSPSVATSHEDFEFDIRSNEAVLTRYLGDKRVVHVPDQVFGMPVTQIGVGAFEDMAHVRSVRLPNSTRFIARRAFKDCTDLQGVYLGEALRTIGTSAFEGCVRLRALQLPDSLRTIRQAAFAGCAALVSSLIPAGVATLEARTFAGCSSLQQIVLSEGLQSLDDQVFEGCTSLKVIRCNYRAALNRSGTRPLVLRDGLPTTLTHMGTGLFENCASLAAVRLPSGVERIPARAFLGCTDLSEVLMHNRVKRVGGQAFTGCASLQEIRVPFGCKQISATAFDPNHTIVASRTSAPAKFALRNGIGFRPIHVEDQSARQSSMVPAGNSSSADSYFSERQRRNAVENFQVRPAAIAPPAEAVDQKTPFTLVDGIYTRDSAEEGTARIMLVGDIMARARQIRAARDYGRYNFDPQFRFIRETLSQGDFVVGALETHLSPRHLYSDATTKIDPTGYYNAPPELAHTLARVGFDAVANANNHVYDLGVEGIFDTLEQLNYSGLAHTGIYVSSSDRRFEIFDIGGFRISLHSFLQPDMAVDKQANFTVKGRKTLFSYATPESISRQLTEARAKGAEFSIAYCHWGQTGSVSVTEEQRDTAQLLVEAGADLIVGTHPHLVQPFEWLSRDDGTQAGCLWSAGDFIADTPVRSSLRQDALILEVTLTRKEGQPLTPRIRYRPCRIMNLAKGRGGDSDFVTVSCSSRLDNAAEDQELTQARFRLGSIMEDRLYPAELLPTEARPRVPQSIQQVDHQINLALDSLECFEFPEYERANYGRKRDLDPVVLSASASRMGLETLIVHDDYHVYHRDGRLLPFYMHMSSNLTKLDRDATNNKDLTRRILTRAEIPIARGVLVKHERELADAFEIIGTPLVVKPEAGSFGRGVRLSIESLDELREAALPLLRSGQNVLVEEMFQGIDLRIAVVDGEARAATFRVPANVIGDGTSTIAELAEQKNALRFHNDYISHQTIKFTPGILEFLDKLGLSLDSVPPKDKRIFLHHVANISAGGDSYEVIHRLHPDLKALAVKTAALFPSALHSGIDILAQSLDQGFDVQRAIVCEVNLNNELPLHTNPVAGTPTALGDIELAIHWEQESRDENLEFFTENATVPLRSRLEIDEVLAKNLGSVTHSGTTPRTIRNAEFQLLAEAIDKNLKKGAKSRVSADGFVYIKDADSEWVTDISGNKMHPRAVARWYGIKAGLSEALGIRYFVRHDLLDASPESVKKLVSGPLSTWNLRGVDSTGSAIRQSIDSADELLHALGELRPPQTLFLEEAPVAAQCTILVRGKTILATQLLVPFGVCGDGVSTLEDLVHAQLETRSRNPLTQLNRCNTKFSELISVYDGATDVVLEPGRWVALSKSFKFSEGAIAVGLPETPWPELTEYVDRIVRVWGSPGLSTITFALRNGDAGTHWAWLSSSSTPRLATFLYPHLGHSYDGFDEHAQFLAAQPRQYL